MTFADLYHLHEKCMEVEKDISDTPNNHDGFVPILAGTYDDIKFIIIECKSLIYDVCQTKVEDVIKRDT